MIILPILDRFLFRLSFLRAAIKKVLLLNKKKHVYISQNKVSEKVEFRYHGDNSIKTFHMIFSPKRS